MNLDKICHQCFSESLVNNICKDCVNHERDEDVLPLGTMLKGRYLIGKVLGRGGFGVTYLCLDLQTMKKKAVKECFPYKIAHRVPGRERVQAEDEELMEYILDRFFKEAGTLYKYRTHPNIAQVEILFKDNGTAYFVMEYIQGMSLRSVQERYGGRIPYDTLISYILPVMDVLKYVHRDNLIHRDISPDNIMIGQSVKLIDFGAARMAHANNPNGLTKIMKNRYAPIEQMFRHGNQGPWSDVFALAATMYDCLTGEQIPTVNERFEGKEIKALKAYQIQIPEHVEQAIMKALAVKIEDRFQSVAEFGYALTNPGYTETTKYRISGINGYYAGASFSHDGKIIFGRNASVCQIVFPLDAKQVSRVHCGIFMSEDKRKVYLQDFHSTYGTIHNGYRMKSGDIIQVNSGDWFSIGIGHDFIIEY